MRVGFSTEHILFIPIAWWIEKCWQPPWSVNLTLKGSYNLSKILNVNIVAIIIPPERKDKNPLTYCRHFLVTEKKARLHWLRLRIPPPLSDPSEVPTSSIVVQETVWEWPPRSSETVLAPSSLEITEWLSNYQDMTLERLCTFEHRVWRLTITRTGSLFPFFLCAYLAYYYFLLFFQGGRDNI